MGKKEFTAEVKGDPSIIKESKNSNWCKVLCEVSYNGGPTNIDIRNVKFNEDGTQMFGKGISMTKEETDIATDILLEKGFGTLDKINEIAKKRNSIFAGAENILEDDDDEDEFDEMGRLVVRLGKKIK